MPDPTTQSNYLKITSVHVSFDWAVDFVKKIISGSATHDLIVKESGVNEVMWVENSGFLGGMALFSLSMGSFDTADITIESVKVQGQDVSVRYCHWGCQILPLMMSLFLAWSEAEARSDGLCPAHSFTFRVEVGVLSGCESNLHDDQRLHCITMARKRVCKHGLTHWPHHHTARFNLRQTQGKKFPYLFSQCQPIYARALAPLQGECSSWNLARYWCLTNTHLFV